MCEVHKYPGTAHSFFNDTRPDVYKEEAAAEAWAITLAFLDKYILADHPGVRPLPDSQRVPCGKEADHDVSTLRARRTPGVRVPELRGRPVQAERPHLRQVQYSLPAHTRHHL